jgi:hypothetical protein
MTMIQIELEGGPACIFPSSADYRDAISVWTFLIQNLKPGRWVLLMDESGQTLRAAKSGDTKRLPPWPGLPAMSDFRRWGGG